MAEAPLRREVALWHPDGRRVWRTAAGDWPAVSLDAGQPLEAALRATFGEIWPLHDGGHLFGQAGLIHAQALNDGLWSGEGAWSEVQPGPIPHARPWQRPGWPAQVNALADGLLKTVGLTRQGEVEWHSAHDLTATNTVPTEAGRAWLKVCETGQEAALSAHLGACHPGLLPPVLAADPARCALLTLDGGELLDSAADPQAWTQALERLAGFQRSADAAALAGLGAPGFPLTEMAECVDALLGETAALHTWGLAAETLTTLQDARPRIRAAFSDLHGHGLPNLPAHGDAHPRNALYSPARGAVWFDWSEAASAAHPFMDAGWFLAFALHPSREGLPVRQAGPDLPQRLVTAYLRALGAPDAAPLLWQALPLALLHRAAVYDRTFRTWTGTVPGVRPNYTPYYLRLAAREVARLT
ncbi:phosphotransferase [Deinococcus arboris]|uniref:phosphotransferase n=1 Tax=Deinococcus arboris TaxID=2682977 RepID=UPI0018DDE954